MMQAALVVDANILIRAVLGTRVRGLIQAHAVSTRFFAPDTAFDEARRHLPALMKKRGVDPAAALSVLTALEGLVQVLEPEVYGSVRQEALKRIGGRDVDDWPVLACAMVLGSPVWTEDADFFGTGVATWTSDRIELFLSPREGT